MQKVKDLIQRAKNFFENPSVSTVVFSILIIALLCVILSFAITILCMSIGGLISFLNLHFDFLMTILTGILIFIWWVKGRKPDAHTPMKPPVSVDLQHARARANERYQAMRSVALILMCDVCQYIGNALIKPFSLSSIESPAHYEITSDGIIRYQFVIAKGEGEIDAATLKNIIDRCLKQRLDSHTCPGLPVEPYRSANGDVYDPVKCMGVYDCSSFWRVDLVLTNEAVVTHLINAEYGRLESKDHNESPLDDRHFN